MSEPQSIRAARSSARDEPRSALSDFEAKEAANLANENCDRAMALAHKLTAQLREAQDRINQLESHTEGLQADAELAVAKLQSEADARIDRTKREADKRITRAVAEVDERLVRARAEMESQIRRLETEFAHAKLRADRAEQWLVVIRREIEGRLIPSFAAMHDRLTPAKTD
jgi:hypothetical protein